MIVMPPEFVLTKWPGYVWNTSTQRLWTFKVTGVLRPLKLQRPNIYNTLQSQGYRISHEGRKFNVELIQLKELNKKAGQMELFQQVAV